MLIVNHLTVLPNAQVQSCGNGSRHLVYASVYFREYDKGLILMFIMSPLLTAIFFVIALFESLNTQQASVFTHKLQKYSSIFHRDFMPFFDKKMR